MKTLKQITKRLEQIYNKCADSAKISGLSKTERSALKKEALKLETVKNYLLSNPTETFIKKQLEATQNKIKRRLELAEKESKHIEHTKARNELKKIILKREGFNELRKQEGLLEFILS